MDRKKFIAGLSLLSAGKLASSFPMKDYSTELKEKEKVSYLIPPYLNPGDTIGIVSPAGWISEADIEPAINRIKSWGFNVLIGSSIGKRDFTFGGTDEERATDFQAMLDNRSVKAILCARGGYGMVRIIDRLDFSKFRQHPKWIIGFSDITVLHSHLHQNFRVATLHSKMCNSFPIEFENDVQKISIESIRDCLTGKQMTYELPSHVKNKIGTCTGRLIGGNLKTIESLTGSGSDLSTKGKILFLEDTQEYLYSIDRMLWNLKRSGKLQDLSGLILGGFKIKSDEKGEEFGRTIEDLVLEKTQAFSYPICFGFPAGHQLHNLPLKCGVMHKLEVKTEKTTLTEILKK